MMNDLSSNKPWWCSVSDYYLVWHTVAINRMDCPFSVFHSAIEHIAKRPVLTDQISKDFASKLLADHRRITIGIV